MELAASSKVLDRINSTLELVDSDDCMYGYSGVCFFGYTRLDFAGGVYAGPSGTFERLRGMRELSDWLTVFPHRLKTRNIGLEKRKKGQERSFEKTVV